MEICCLSGLSALAAQTRELIFGQACREGKIGAVSVGAKAHLATCEAEQAQPALLIIILISNIFWRRTKVCLAEADGRGGRGCCLIMGRGHREQTAQAADARPGPELEGGEH